MEFLVAQFQAFRLGVQLVLREAFGQNGLDVIDRMGLQKIENHGIRNHELTIDRLGPSGQPTHQHAQIHVR